VAGFGGRGVPAARLVQFRRIDKISEQHAEVGLGVDVAGFGGRGPPASRLVQFRRIGPGG
jgi:hypothetical protein